MISYVRSNNPRLEHRSRRIIDVLGTKGQIIIWNRNPDDTVEKQWSTLQLESGYGVSMFKLLPRWWKFVFMQLHLRAPHAVHCCNFDCAPPCLAYCIIYRKKLIYDIWDCASGMLPINAAVVWFLNLLERGVCMLSHALLIPDPERLEQLGFSKKSKIRDKTHIIWNSQPFSNWKNEERIIGRGMGEIKLIYSGTLSTQIRGLEQLVEALDVINGGVYATVIGYGKDADIIVPLLNKSNHISFLGKKDPDEIREITKNHDATISLLDPKFTNYKHATSTKALEAIALGIPVITTKNTATGRLIEEYDWGWTIDYSTECLIELLTKLKTKGQKVTLDRERVKHLDWNETKKELALIYRSLDNQFANH